MIQADLRLRALEDLYGGDHQAGLHVQLHIA